MFRWLYVFLLASGLLVGSFAVAPVADSGVTILADVAQGPLVPFDVATAPKLVQVASLAEALSPKAAAYAEGDISGCTNGYVGSCWVNFCSSWGVGSGTIYFVSSRYGYTSTSPFTMRMTSDCNNWVSQYYDGHRQGLYVWAGDPVYWISNGQTTG